MSHPHLNASLSFILRATGCSEEFLDALVHNLPPPVPSFVLSIEKKQGVRDLVNVGLSKTDAIRVVSGHFNAEFLYKKFLANPDLFVSTYLS